MMKRLRPWQVVLIVGLVYVGLTLAHNNFDAKRLALIGSLYDPGLPDGRPGYDGQFAYQIARDPLNGWTKIDIPAYRYQRILYPLLARALALGNVDVVPWTLLSVNIAALAVGAWCLEEMLALYRASRWYALAFGLSAGIMMSVRLDLAEPLAYALALGGTWLALKDRWRGAAVLFALAALTKETTLLFVAGIVLVYVLRRAWHKVLIFGAIALLPFVTWQAMLWQWFGQPGIGSGGALATPFEIIPLRGLWTIPIVNVRVLALVILMLLLAVIPGLISLWAAMRDGLHRQIDIPMAVLLFNALAILIAPQSTFREPLGMARYVVGLVGAVLLYAASRRNQRVLNYALLWILTLALALNESQLPV